MKFSPSDIAVLILAACVPMTLVGHILNIVMYGPPENTSQFAQITEYWMQFLTFLAGGVFGWVVPKSDK